MFEDDLFEDDSFEPFRKIGQNRTIESEHPLLRIGPEQEPLIVAFESEDNLHVANALSEIGSFEEASSTGDR